MRLFSAIELNASVASRLVEVQRHFKPAALARWSPPENFHLTLRFYGQWPEERLGELETSLATVESPESIPIELTRLAFFPNERGPRVLAALANPAPELLALQERLDKAAIELGFARDKRAYTPHVTLARMQDLKRATKLVESVRSSSWVLGSFTARGFALFESERTPTGARYRRVANWA